MYTRCRYGRNRIAALLAAVICGLAAFSGCAETIEPKSAAVTTTVQTTTVTTTAATTTVTEPVTSAETEKPAETAPPETTVTEAAPEPEPSRSEQVYEAAQHIDGLTLEASDTAGVYEIKGLLEEAPDIEYLNGITVAFERAGDNAGNDGLTDHHIRVYDPAQGLLLGETDSLTTGYYPYNRETCGAFAGGFYSCMGKKVRLMDIGMNVTDEFELPAEQCSRLWLTDSGRYLLYNSKRGPSRLYDTAAHAEIELSKHVKAVCVTDCGGDGFDIVNTKGQRFRITSAGEVEPCGSIYVPEYYYEQMDMLEGRVLDSVPAGLCVRRPESGTARLIDYPTKDIAFILSATERYIAFTDTENITRIIDLQEGKISEPIGRGAFAARGNGSDGSFIFLDDPEQNGNYRCMLAVPSEAEYKKAVGVSDIDTDRNEYLLYFKAALPDSERTSSLLKELHEKYNVRVAFSPVSETELYSGYCCKAYTGEKATILESLRNFLALSPPGILREAAEGGAETWILISSNIVDDPGQTSYGTAGFASMIDLHPFVALETPASASEKDYMTDSELYAYCAKYMTDNFSHEFIHIIDGKTTEEQTRRWKALSPDDSYFGTYDSVSGDTSRYVEFGGTFDNKVYFVDSYARVNELEDKARTGEHLYYAREGGSETSRGKFARSRSLYAKAAELAVIFRENYPCLEAIPKGEWYLEKPLLGSFDELKKQWKAEEKENTESKETA